MSKIMLIEDDQTMAGLLTILLGIEGFDVFAFKGGGDILPGIRSEHPEVILLDVNLKNLGGRITSGFDLLPLIRQDEELCQICVIISSGMNYQDESKAAGADGFIMKPYMPDTLLKLIKSKLN